MTDVGENRSRSSGKRPRWARVALVVTRCFVTFTLAAALAVLVFAQLGMEATFNLGSTVAYEKGAIVIDAEPPEPVPLCSPRIKITRSDSQGIDGIEVPTVCPATRSARRSYGPGAEVSTALAIRVAHPTRRERAGFFAILVLGFVAILTFQVSIERILKRTVEGHPFDPRNVSALRRVALAIALFSGVTPWLTDRYASRMLDAHAQVGPEFFRGVPQAIGTVSYMPVIGAVLLVLVLAEVLRYGINLQRDVEATV